MKIAMWSGPRNLSTAMMYAFGNRKDFKVWDEPFYAAYLAETGIDHPMRQEILATYETDDCAVSNSIQDEKGSLFLKLMSFHMRPGFSFSWADECVHIHLIRHPARVIASYVEKRERPNLTDIGFEHQAELYQRFPGPVVDSFDIRSDPMRTLGKLCAEIELPFDLKMLSWAPGPKPFDGLWAEHWYDAVHRSAGFSGPEGAIPELDEASADLMQAALPFYEDLRAKALS